MKSTSYHHRKKYITNEYHVNYLASEDGFFKPFEDQKTERVIDLESKVRLSTVGYVDALRTCNQCLDFSRIKSKRVITSPPTPAHNDGKDNIKYDYIITTDEVIGTGVVGVTAYGKRPNSRYRILSKLGEGAFGQVVKCYDEVNKVFVAVKILKNRPAYYRQAMLEIAILQLLSERFDVENTSNTLRMVDHFVFHHHICIVTELLSINLYELMKQNNCRALFVGLARNILTQILESLTVCYKSGIIHCDLKPENVLLVDMTKKIKLIDFGSACFENSTLYSYIQSRHYRSPEVILGLPYSTAIDMWSFGCMAAELFVGIPIFPGNSEYNMLYKWINFLGYPPKKLLDAGKKTEKYFRRKRPAEMKDNDDVWILKTKREFESDNDVYTEPNREYFAYKSLEDIAMKVNFRVSAEDEPRKIEMRRAFLDFIQKCLRYDPESRMRPDQALQHPFITKKSLSEYTIQPSDEPLKTFPPGSQLNSEDVLNMIAPNPAAAAKLKSMGYNATTYYQVYADGLRKGIVLNILNSNPFALNPMTPPSLIRIFQKESLERSPKKLLEMKGGEGDKLAQAQIQFKRIEKSMEEDVAQKREGKTQKLKAPQPIDKQGKEELNKKRATDGWGEQKVVHENVEKEKRENKETFLGSYVAGVVVEKKEDMGSWSTNVGMIVPRKN
ncbi:serine/threonine protein kinase ppk15, putative [Entamoeba invadens IP1]|uniref:Serine/threonine protein kinase ppk15, putative n=1 Tax=Entamoeba invadens IP1 TaxID=370355 RepID=A0A0A1U568_ENTIV|nr:serine/threonine protein kinase ppk15, putative [Entamoeba invadens IP1]ELP86891.1 serine/threonine protein kinase ppk15, putative [Entamoeba invadens IP1]|eukprot:XP_004253662.1 serine/threonine protein kinase ppk15, putative [Entamoeba invadens IP1]